MAEKKTSDGAKKESSVKQILIPTIALLLIAGVSSFLLAFVNSATAPIISEREAEELAATMRVVSPEAESFSDEKTVEHDGEETSYYEAKDKDGNIIGYVFLTSGSGYGGEISVMTGIGADGKITGVKLLSINETPGLGMRANSDDFLSQYSGKSGSLTLSKSATGDEIQALTGATITSKAVTGAVNTALACYDGLVKEGE